MHDDGRTREELLREIESLRQQLDKQKELEAELERAREELKVSETNYRAIFEAANDAIYVHDIETGAMLDVNQRMLEMYGFSKDEVLNLPPTDEYLAGPPFTAEKIVRLVRKAAESDEPILFEWLAKHKSGRLFWVEVSLKRAIIGGQPRLLAIVRDIDERKRAENVIRESEERYRSLLEAVDDSINIKDAQGRYLMVNSEFCRRMGRSREEVLGKTIWDLHDPKSVRQVEQADRKVLETGATVDAEEYHPNRQRGKVTHVRKAPLRNATGDVIGVVTVSRDITERKRLEEQLLRAQRLEAAGMVASQVAHDFNNLLSPLTAYPELIKLQLPPDHPAQMYCDAMIDAAERMASINEDMLALGRRGLFDVELVDFNRLVKQAIEQLPDRPSSVDIRVELASDLMRVTGSPAQLMRVITNLLLNALDATEGAGTITVTTENVYLETATTGYCCVPIGEYVRLSMADTGCGIPPEIRNKIFEAFYSTKTRTKRRGCGLGLSIVQSIVEDHNGYIDMESEVGKGTAFRIYLPASRQLVGKTEKAPLPIGNESVLVVDDDPLQRQVISELLGSLGYQVESA
ncbi:MAG: PAS domain S-box protein, partial [Chloroflexota bacterium]